MLRLLKQAALVAVPRSHSVVDHRAFYLGAVGVRGDGVLVSSQNGSVKMSETVGGGWSYPQAHAEYRCARKMDFNGIVYVARVRPDGCLAIARPCRDCQIAMAAKRVLRCYYTISDTEYGVIELSKALSERTVRRSGNATRCSSRL